MKNSGGARLNNNFELFTVGFHSADGRRSMDHFNFGPNDGRSNIVSAPAVTNKMKHSGDNRVVNIYQKPRILLDWMVGHFSFPGDWVMDLCSGSGTGLASALAHGRRCIAVEKDVRQCSVLKGRVLSLVAHLDGDDLSSFAPGEDVGTVPVDSQPPLPPSALVLPTETVVSPNEATISQVVNTEGIGLSEDGATGGGDENATIVPGAGAS